MNFTEKLEALQKQAEELKNMFMKVQGAIELTTTLMKEEEESEKSKKAAPKKKE